MKYLLTLILYLATVGLHHSLGKDKIINVNILDYCPQICFGENQRGYVFEIFREVFKAHHYKFKYFNKPWARGVTETTSGDVDILIPPSLGEAPDLIFSKEAIGTQNECFYGRSDDEWELNGMKSFINRKTIVFKQWTFEKEYSERLGLSEYKKRFLKFSLDKKYLMRAFKMVSTNRADAFWMETSVFDYYLKKNPTKSNKKIKMFGCLLAQKLFVGFTPVRNIQSRKLSKQFDEGIRRLRKAGKLAKILSRYNVRDWELK